MKEITITIHQFRSRARIGCTEEERAFPQSIEFDIELNLPTDAATSDSLADTVDYMAVTETISEMCEEKEWRLLEKLAADIGNQILIGFASVNEVKVLVRKFILPEAQCVSCALTLTR